MKRNTLITLTSTLVLALATGAALASDRDRDQMRDRDSMSDKMMDRDRDRDQLRDKARDEYGDKTVYGWQMMSLEERDSFRNRMRAMKTQEEREAFRLQHHEEMRERARQKGVTLPEVPPHMPGGRP